MLPTISLDASWRRSSAPRAGGGAGSRTWAWSPVGDLPPSLFSFPSDPDLARLPGQWALVSRAGGQVRLAVDPMRSRVLLFAFHDGRWVVADSPDALRALVPWRLDRAGAAQLRHLGFSLGARTLVEGVRSVQAAHTVVLRDDGSWDQRPYMRYRRGPDLVEDPDEFAGIFGGALRRCVSRLVAAAGRSQLVVPLSGGLDSRLLATALVEAGAPRLAAFSYGVPGCGEEAVARGVADSLGIPFTAVRLDPDRMAERWRRADGFRRATWGATSLPHVQDWYALRELRCRRLIDDDAVIVPGHTIVGNAHDCAALARRPSPAQAARLITLYHGSLQGAPGALRRDPDMALALRETARDAGVGAGASEAALQSWVEWFNLRERQAKYINMSMRAYEYFGYGWAAPMLDADMWRAWLRGGPGLTRDRGWYAGFVDALYSSVSASPPRGYYSAPGNDHGIPPGMKRAALRLMGATGADRALARARSVRAQLRHPMGFEAFSRQVPQPLLALRYMTGATALGTWARLFTDNRWGGPGRIVPEGEGA